jgi:hypothetical protein
LILKKSQSPQGIVTVILGPGRPIPNLSVSIQPYIGQKLLVLGPLGRKLPLKLIDNLPC